MGEEAIAGTLTLGGDLTVRRLGFGAMRITGPGAWGEPVDRDAMRRLLRRAVELGVTLIDTADAYGPEVSERLIAEALHPYPEDLVIATKGGLLIDGPWRWRPDGRPEHLKAACAASLQRLRRDRIDLYQLHTVDPRVPVEESVGALADLQAAGMIRHIGLCNVDAGQLARARAIAPIVSVQNCYNLYDRGDEQLVEFCARDGLGYIPWNPLGAGWIVRTGGTLGALSANGAARPIGQALAQLARRWPARQPRRGRSRLERAAWLLAGPGSHLTRIAARRGVTPAAVALAWLLRRSPAMLPIPGR